MSTVKTSKTATKGDAKVTKKEPVVKKEKDTVAKKEPVAKKEKASKKEEVATPVPVKEEEVVAEVAADVTNEVVVADNGTGVAVACPTGVIGDVDFNAVIVQVIHKIVVDIEYVSPISA